MAARSNQREYNRAYYLAHREDLLARRSAHHSERRAEHLAYAAAYRAAHPERVAESKARWFQQNKEWAYAARKANPRYAEHARNARRKRVGGVVPPEWQGLVEYFEGCCAYCGGFFGDRLEPDHVIPLARGGSRDIGNILPACRSCNAKKGARTWAQWKPEWAAHYLAMYGVVA